MLQSTVTSCKAETIRQKGMVEKSCLPDGKGEPERKGQGTRYTEEQWNASLDSLSLTALHLLTAHPTTDSSAD